MSPRGDDAGDSAPEADPDLPALDDEYLTRVAERLQFNYDLDADRRVHGESFALSGTLTLENHKQFLHSALSYGHHESVERLYARRCDGVNVADLEALVALGHDLGMEIDADEEHFSTEFTFALVAPQIPDEVREFVAGFSDRTLLKYGYHGHYEINLLVVAPDTEQLVASENAEVAVAFRLWESDEPESSGLAARLAGLFG
ncbi:hypothetical protein [Halococcus thailandensis]|uniref:DUF8052 domain-containing protein n=1 Tax=Halococcus thailandensis JCM 13552 TaxID=1227457 RepID=M0N300_9EURY|nr:hypothetical protein [Halococcus thailandensis]EMA52251.1 hypothetical protein C451_11915 [Halococcus thailandensis JCM 13552]